MGTLGAQIAKAMDGGKSLVVLMALMAIGCVDSPAGIDTTTHVDPARTVDFTDSNTGIRWSDGRYVPVGLPAVRVIYAVPSDVEPQAEYESGIMRAMIDMQEWIRAEMDGETFALETALHVCRLQEPEAFFLESGLPKWTRFWRGRDAVRDQCADIVSELEYATAVFLDVNEQCSQSGEFRAASLPTTTRAGYFLLGGVHIYAYGGETSCGRDAVYHTGYMGHELGHALGLRHPTNCVAQAETCDVNALMWHGGFLGLWPDDTYLRDDEREILDANPIVRAPPGR